MPVVAETRQVRGGPTVQQVRSRLALSQEALAQVLGVSARTIVRWESETATPSRLALDRLERLGEVLRLAEQIFPKRAIASWLRTPNPTLRGRTPADVLVSRGGLDEIYHLLGRMAWGIPT